jgi:hypothetical protein
MHVKTTTVVSAWLAVGAGCIAGTKVTDSASASDTGPIDTFPSGTVAYETHDTGLPHTISPTPTADTGHDTGDTGR